jgi:hypothetical protein
MKRAISRVHTSVVGNVASVHIVPGGEVDLDQVVGHQDGRPCTLADALGPLLESFNAVGEPAAERQVSIKRSSRGRTTTDALDAATETVVDKE